MRVKANPELSSSTIYMHEFIGPPVPAYSRLGSSIPDNSRCADLSCLLVAYAENPLQGPSTFTAQRPIVLHASDAHRPADTVLGQRRAVSGQRQAPPRAPDAVLLKPDMHMSRVPRTETCVLLLKRAAVASDDHLQHRGCGSDPPSLLH